MKENIIEEAKDLDLSWLPEKIGDYELSIEQAESSQITYHYFIYENDAGWRWESLYNEEVGDYTVQIVLPLLSFTDIEMISQGFDGYWQRMHERFPKALESKLVEPHLSYEYKTKEIPTWHYEAYLPPQVGEYERILTPDRGIEMINGSYIMAMYHKKGAVTGLILFYNTLRDEFFAELRKDGYPIITHDLDAKTIKELEKVLHAHLEELLYSLDTSLQG